MAQYNYIELFLYICVYIIYLYKTACLQVHKLSSMRKMTTIFVHFCFSRHKIYFDFHTSMKGGVKDPCL